ncbi:MAG: hypothetical protein JXA42_07800 [Anaerolineales bacterium]|nr:hypothetical protein [Anaerolineales bacterium]
MLKTALIGGWIIDGNGGTPLLDSAVVIIGSKILDISQQREFGSDVNVVDVSGKTVMPGLIDTHNHFAPWIQWLINFQDKSLAYMGCKTVYMLKATLDSNPLADIKVLTDATRISMVMQAGEICLDQI